MLNYWTLAPSAGRFHKKFTELKVALDHTHLHLKQLIMRRGNLMSKYLLGNRWARDKACVSQIDCVISTL